MNKAILRFFLLISCANAGAATAAPAVPAPVEWHETMLNRLAAKGPEVGDAKAVFAYVFAQLNAAITIYPSEGYYYFQYYSDGDLIKGNIRLDRPGRERGEVSFAYFYASELGDTDRDGQTPDGISLGLDDGLVIEKVNEFTFNLTFAGKTVKAKIYEAANERADPPQLYGDEVYVGPAFDDSGVRFHLIFNRQKKLFYFLLNSQFGFPESYQSLAPEGPEHQMLIGLRSKFSFLHDQSSDRMYLIGVNLRNVVNNTMYDGPFDQLPDSFIDPLALRDMIVAADPSVKGKLGPYGHYLKADGVRYAIAPYIQYMRFADLKRFANCVKPKADEQEVPICLAKRLPSN